MNIRKLPYDTSVDVYFDYETFLVIEGEAYRFASKGERIFVIKDYGTMTEYCDDDPEMLENLKTEYEFESKEECKEFVIEIQRSHNNTLEQDNIPGEIIKIPQRLL